jgi:ABC-type antimicrobial peptide transport system permease subunit
VLLASIGLYGLLAYAVCLRTREIGLRMALGARPGRILRDLLQQGLRLVLIGLALGGGSALIVSRWMEVLLFEVTPADPLAFAGATLLLLVVAVSASLLPARRALRVEPQAALRAD